MPEPDAEVSLADNINNVIGFLKRRRWWIAAPACVIALATVGVLFRLPNRYTSEATILVVQQQVPERYVVPTATSDISKALEAMTQEVLSRTRLLGVIEEFGLYPEEKRHLAAERLVKRMRRDVSITPLQSNPELREVNAFKIAFIADSAHLAQKVASRLTTLFIEQNLKRRADQATTTTRFLNEQLDTAKKKLAEQEQQVRDFKMQHLGELPEQQQGNLGILSGLQSQLDSVMGNLNRAKQQRLYLESLTSEYRRLPQRRVPVIDGSGGRETLSPVEAAQRDLRALEAERSRLLSLYKPEHPDVLKKGQEIIRQQELIKSLSAAGMLGEQPAGPDKSAQASGSKKPPARIPEGGEETATLAQLRSQLEANRLEIENLKKTEAKLQADIERYQSRLNQTPVREQQLATMLRDLDLLKQNYSDLLKKEQESQMATSLEKRQEGQQFRLVDPPNLPEVPSSPKRLKISLGGIAAGLALGLALAFLMETRDSSFRAETDVSRRLGLRLVVGIPQLLTRREQRIMAWKRSFEWLAGTVMAAAVFAAEFYVYRHQ